MDGKGQYRSFYDWKTNESGVFTAASSDRNKEPIAHHLDQVFFPLLDPTQGTILECGSGTGQLIQLLASSHPNFSFQASEILQHGRDAISARCANQANVSKEILNIDFESDQSVIDHAGGRKFSGVFLVNVLHVMPDTCIPRLARLCKLVDAHLVAIYGAFKRHGRHTTDSNQDFDKRLRGMEPSLFGVRDVESEVVPAMFREGFLLFKVLDMPSNNFLLVFRRHQDVASMSRRMVPVNEAMELFKVVGTESSVMEYTKKNPPADPKSDWAGMYFQLNAAHALGTIGYRWEKYTTAKLLRVLLRPRVIAVVSESFMWNASIAGSEKALMVKHLLGLDSCTPLMTSLESQGAGMLCLETEHEWEIVIPHALLKDAILLEETICTFAPNEFKATSKMSRVEGQWSRFDESSFGPNEPPSWIEKYVFTTAGLL